MKYFYSAADFCAHIAKLFKQVTPIAGPGIRIEDTANGKRISCTIEPVTNRSSGVIPGYKGPFAIVDNGDDSFKCVNNALSDAAQTAFPAGVVYFGYYTRSVAALLDIPTDNIVWLESKYNGSDYVSELKCGTALPEYVVGVNIYVVGITGDIIDQQLRDNYDLKWVLV